MLHEKAPEGPDGVHDSETEIPNESERREIVGKEPVQRIRCGGERERIEATPSFVATKHVHCAEIETQPRGIQQHFCQRRHILEPEIQSLARNGRNAVCRIANPRQGQLYIFARQVEAQWIGPARPTSMDTSQVRAEASRNL